MHVQKPDEEIEDVISKMAAEGESVKILLRSGRIASGKEGSWCRSHMNAKRGFDVCISAVALILLAPLIVGIALLVLVFIGRPILFVQVRPGLEGRPFRMYKFRSMTAAYAPDGGALPDSSRLTRFGHFLRSTSLDELPELWNVLLGNMSLVGPRPLLQEYLPLYTPEQARRHEVRPGITGWAQVKGRNLLSWEEKFTLDVWYVENQSFWLDLRILWLSVHAVLARQGISHGREVTMPKFTGTAR